jgi:hypothetical protein
VVLKSLLKKRPLNALPIAVVPWRVILTFDVTSTTAAHTNPVS